MKSIYSALLLLLVCTFAKAELPDGVMAPNWTLSDFQTGETFTLQDYIDAGIPVILDFSATWCPPCWSYHQQHILADMYDEYGPTGTVEQDAAMVFFMEGDYSTNDDCLYGDDAACGQNTMGDWTDGTPYPIFNIPASSGVTGAYQITYWPTLYIVSPQGTIFETGQVSKSTWESWIFETFALAVDGSTITQMECPEDGGSIDLEVSGGAGNLTFVWNNGATTQNLADVPPGEYFCTITEGRGYSIQSEVFIIEEGPEPIVASAVEQDVLCNGDGNGFISLTADGGTGTISYSWNTGETTASIENLSGGTYTVEMLDENNCMSSATYIIEEPEVLTQSSTSFPSYCGEDNGLISVMAQGGSSPFVYTINGQSNTSGVFEQMAAGGHIVDVVDNNGCSILFSIFIEEIPEPVAVAEASQQPTCATPQVILSGEGSSESGVSYQWSSSDGGTIISGANTLYPVVEGNGTYVLVVTDGGYGCQAEASVVVSGNVELPTADAGLPQSITCDVLEVQLDGSASSQGDEYSYQWSTLDGNIIEGGDTELATVNAAGNYVLEVTNTTNGCVSTSTVEVTQTAELPVADAGDSQELTCATTIVTLDGSGSDVGDDIIYTWTSDDGDIVEGANTLNPTVNTPGSYLLEVYNSVSGCVSYASVVVVENTTAPEGNILDAEVLTCALDQQALVIMVEGDDITYNWSTQDGNIVEGSTSDMPIIDAPGTYEVSFIDNATGCSSSASITVEEFIDEPIAAFSYTSEDTEFSFTSESEGSPTEYLWDFGDGSTSTFESPFHQYVEEGTYEVCLTITNDCGVNTTCSTITITIGAPLTFDSSLTSPTCNSDCSGTLEIDTDADIEEITTVITGPDGFVAENVYSLTDLCAGTYTVEITNQLEETATETIEIAEPDAILVDDSEIMHIACAGDGNGRINLDVSGGTGDLTITWNTGDEGPTLENLNGGQYEATIEDAQGCTEVVTFDLDEPTPVDVDTESITNIDDDNPTGAIDITVAGGTPEYMYLWSNGDQTEDVTGLDVGEFTVIITDANGCSDTYGPFEIKNLVAIKQIEKLEKFEIAPNPTVDQFNLKLEFEARTQAIVSLVNNLGQVILSESLNETVINKEYDLSNYPAGVYMLRVQVGDSISIKKVIKQ